MGRFGSAISARLRRSARAIAFTAGSCPITTAPSAFSIPRSFSAVVAFIFSTGTPLIDETVSAMSFSVISSVSSACVSFHFLSSAWKSAAACFKAARYCAAESKSPFATTASFLPRKVSMFSCISVRRFGRALAPALNRAPVSSSASIALSGSCRAGR